MDDDRFAVELFAAEARPNESEKNAHEKDDDWFGGVGGGGSEGYGWSGDEGGAVGELLHSTDKTVDGQWN